METAVTRVGRRSRADRALGLPTFEAGAKTLISACRWHARRAESSM